MADFFANHSCDFVTVPTSYQYIKGFSTSDIIITSVVSVAALITVLIFCEQYHHIKTHMSNWKPRNKALLLLGIYPVCASNAIITVFVPGSANVTSITTTLYLAVCVYAFSQMLIGHYGGITKMALRLKDGGIPVASPPLCCLFQCLRKPEVNPKNLTIVEGCVMQYVVVRPILIYLFEIFKSNFSPDLITRQQMALATYIFMFFTLSSTFLAVYGNVMLFRLSIEPLRCIHIRPKFFLVMVFITTENMQSFILTMLVKFGVIVCEPPLSTNSNMNRIHIILLIFESLLMAIVARIYYNKEMHDETVSPADHGISQLVSQGMVTSHDQNTNQISQRIMTSSHSDTSQLLSQGMTSPGSQGSTNTISHDYGSLRDTSGTFVYRNC